MSVFARNAALIRQKKEIIKMTTAGKNNKTTSNRVALYGLLIALAFVLSFCHQSGAGDLSRFYFWEYGIHSIWISRGVFKPAFNGHMQIFPPF